jgi:hypothetical protein
MLSLIAAVALSGVAAPPIAMYESRSVNVLLYAEQGEHCPEEYRRAIVNEEEACYAFSEVDGNPFVIVATPSMGFGINALNFIQLRVNNGKQQ